MDVRNKRAAYTDKNNDILPVFQIAHPRTTAEVNKIQNSRFYVTVYWNPSVKEVVKLEKTWNVSVRGMLNLPWETHCSD